MNSESYEHFTAFSAVNHEAFCIWQKADPAQFVRVFGQPAKINLDPAVAIAAESPQSMYAPGYIITSSK